MAMSLIAEQLLTAAADSEQGIILLSRDGLYQTVIIGSKDFVVSHAPEHVAAVKAAVLELHRMGYVAAELDHFLFTITPTGRQVARRSSGGAGQTR